MRSLVVVTLLSSLIGGLGACKATPAEIATWKGTQRGPGKLREVVKDDGADPSLRALAVAALVEIGMGGEALRDFGTVPANRRTAIVHDLVPALVALLGPSLEGPTPTTTTQRAAKDALFVIRPDAADADRDRIDQVLIKWTTLDLAGRASQGGESSEKILAALGPKVAPMLAPLVKPGPDLLTAARLIGQLGDPDSQKRAAGVLSTVVRGAPGGIHSVDETTLKALGLIGGPDSTAFLLELAQKAGPDTGAKALYALAQGRLSAGDAKALTGTLAIAGDAHAPDKVRDAAFEVTEKLGPAAVNGLILLLGDPNETVRWRAVEAALKAGGAAAIARVLSSLHEDKPVKSEDLDSFVVHDLGLLGKDALPALLEAAKHPPALGQIAALRALGRIGGPVEAAALGSIGDDRGSSRALHPATTVGSEAKQAKAAIEKRGGTQTRP